MPSQRLRFMFASCATLLGVLLLEASVHEGARASQRYRDEIFTAVSVTRDLGYGRNVNSSGQMENLKLDLYEPKGDSAGMRPVMIWIHGGGFTSGDKLDPEIVELCTRFAKRGYITASLDYRLRKQWSTNAEYLAAVKDAREDAQAAVRWFRVNASKYRCDTTRIAIGGSSAGATTALYASYEESPGTSGNAGHSSEVAACVEFWGALTDTSLMQYGEAPVMIVHGTADTKVPYTAALLLQSRAQQVRVPYELHTLLGVGHAAWDHMEELVSWSSDFLYLQVIARKTTGVAMPAVGTPQTPQLLQSYPNPVSLAQSGPQAARAQATIRYEVLRAGTVSLRVFNALGQEVRTLYDGPRAAGIYTQEFVMHNLPLGIYFCRLQTSTEVVTRKILITK